MTFLNKYIHLYTWKTHKHLHLISFNPKEHNKQHTHTNTEILTLKLIYRNPFNLFTLTFCFRWAIHHVGAMYATECG